MRKFKPKRPIEWGKGFTLDDARIQEFWWWLSCRRSSGKAAWNGWHACASLCADKSRSNGTRCMARSSSRPTATFRRRRSRPSRWRTALCRARRTAARRRRCSEALHAERVAREAVEYPGSPRIEPQTGRDHKKTTARAGHREADTDEELQAERRPYRIPHRECRQPHPEEQRPLSDTAQRRASRPLVSQAALDAISANPQGRQA